MFLHCSMSILCNSCFSAVLLAVHCVLVVGRAKAGSFATVWTVIFYKRHWDALLFFRTALFSSLCFGCRSRLSCATTFNVTVNSGPHLRNHRIFRHRMQFVSSNSAKTATLRACCGELSIEQETYQPVTLAATQRTWKQGQLQRSEFLLTCLSIRTCSPFKQFGHSARVHYQ